MMSRRTALGNYSNILVVPVRRRVRPSIPYSPVKGRKWKWNDWHAS